MCQGVNVEGLEAYRQRTAERDRRADFNQEHYRVAEYGPIFQPWLSLPSHEIGTEKLSISASDRYRLLNY